MLRVVVFPRLKPSSLAEPLPKALTFDEKEEAYRVYGILAEGCEIYMPMQEQFLPMRLPCCATGLA